MYTDEFHSFLQEYDNLKQRYYTSTIKAQTYSHFYNNISSNSALIQVIPPVQQFYQNYNNVMYLADSRLRHIQTILQYRYPIVQRIMRLRAQRILITYLCALWWFMTVFSIALHEIPQIKKLDTYASIISLLLCIYMCIGFFKC